MGIVSRGVIDALTEAQRLGFLGSRPVEEAVEHSLDFVEAIPPEARRIVDIGSGGGLPGLVIGARCPDVDLLLVDRREKRTDFLQRVIIRCGWTHVTVRTADVEDLVKERRGGTLERFDVVTARGFGPPATTLQLATQLIAPTGMVVVSEPPTGNRWPSELLVRLGLTVERQGAVSVFRPR